jgi:hypothetical protein
MCPIRSILPPRRNKTVAPCLLLAGEGRNNGRCEPTSGVSGDLNHSLRAEYPHGLVADQAIQNVFQIYCCNLRNIVVFVDGV